MPEILQDPSEVELIAAIETNSYGFMALWDQPGLAGVEFHQEADVIWAKSGLSSAMFNMVAGARFPAGDAAASIERVAAHFMPEGLPFTWWVGPLSQPADLDRRLEDFGLRHATNNAGMAADLAVLDEVISPPAGLSIMRVSDRTALQGWIQVMNDAFKVPAFANSFMDGLFSGLGFDPGAPLQHFLARLEGQPVACASVLLDGSVAGIYNVGTVTEARRQGIGRAVTLTALRHAQAAGYRYSILHASAAGRNVYRKLGFREYCPISIYTWSSKDKTST